MDKRQISHEDPSNILNGKLIHTFLWSRYIFNEPAVWEEPTTTDICFDIEVYCHCQCVVHTHFSFIQFSITGKIFKLFGFRSTFNTKRFRNVFLENLLSNIPWGYCKMMKLAYILNAWIIWNVRIGRVLVKMARNVLRLYISLISTFNLRLISTTVSWSYNGFELDPCWNKASMIDGELVL